MCIYCDSHDKYKLIKTGFWHDTSYWGLCHENLELLCVAAIGFYGLEEREYANTFMKNYIIWKPTGKTDDSHCTHPTAEFVQVVYEDINMIFDSSLYETPEEILHNWTATHIPNFREYYNSKIPARSCIVM